jgi:hypothetical protein
MSLLILLKKAIDNKSWSVARELKPKIYNETTVSIDDYCDFIFNEYLKSFNDELVNKHIYSLLPDLRDSVENFVVWITKHDPDKTFLKQAIASGTFTMLQRYLGLFKRFNTMSMLAVEYTFIIHECLNIKAFVLLETILQSITDANDNNGYTDGNNGYDISKLIVYESYKSNEYDHIHFCENNELICQLPRHYYYLSATSGALRGNHKNEVSKLFPMSISDRLVDDYYKCRKCKKNIYIFPINYVLMDDNLDTLQFFCDLLNKNVELLCNCEFGHYLTTFLYNGIIHKQNILTNWIIDTLLKEKIPIISRILKTNNIKYSTFHEILRYLILIVKIPVIMSDIIVVDDIRSTYGNYRDKKMEIMFLLLFSNLQDPEETRIAQEISRFRYPIILTEDSVQDYIFKYKMPDWMHKYFYCSLVDANNQSVNFFDRKHFIFTLCSEESIVVRLDAYVDMYRSFIQTMNKTLGDLINVQSLCDKILDF